MRNTSIFAYITITLILFQSFSAIANLQDFHVMDTEHLQYEHVHEHDKVDRHYSPSADEVKGGTEQDAAGQNNAHHNPADCHHCGHCHGTHVQWLGQSSLQSIDAIQQFHQFFYLNTVIDAPVNRLLRPPKACS
jgi:hypothetical protein